MIFWSRFLKLDLLRLALSIFKKICQILLISFVKILKKKSMKNTIINLSRGLKLFKVSLLNLEGKYPNKKLKRSFPAF